MREPGQEWANEINAITKILSVGTTESKESESMTPMYVGMASAHIIAMVAIAERLEAIADEMANARKYGIATRTWTPPKTLRDL